MATRLIFYENCQIQLYFGVFENQDLKLINLMINYFESRKISISHPFDLDLNFYEKLLVLSLYNRSKKRKFNITSNNDLIQVDFKRLEYYKKVLEAAYIGFEDQIMEIIENYFDSNDQVLVSAVKNIDEFQLLDHDKLIKQAKLVVFIINKSYFESELFEKHFLEATSLNKKIVFLVDEYDDYTFVWKYPKILLFKVNKSAIEFMGISNWNSQEDSSFDKFISSYQK